MALSRVAIRSTKDKGVGLAVRQVMDSCDWESVVPEGARVVVKPNLCTPSLELVEVANTSPEVLSAVCKVLKTRTEDVVIGESDGIRYSAEEAFTINHTYEVGGEFDFEVKSFSKDELVSVDHPHLRGWPLPRTLLEADVFITIAKIKTHATTAFTGALKNQWGAIPQYNRIILHKYLHTLIGEVNKVLGPKLSITDGLVGMEGRGPINGSPVRLDVVMASQDIVALDSTAMRYVGLDPFDAEHIVHAADIGLGTMDDASIEVESDTEPTVTFDPAEKDWPIKLLDVLSRSPLLTEYVLLNDAIFFPARKFANFCRSVKSYFKGNGAHVSHEPERLT